MKSVPDRPWPSVQRWLEAIKSAFSAIVDALSSIFSEVFDGLLSLFDGDSKSSKSRTASTARTAADALGAQDLATVTPLRTTVEPVQARQEARPRPSAGATGQGSTARVQVVLNGRTIQDVLAVSDARGETTARQTRATGGSGRVSRGRFNRYSK